MQILGRLDPFFETGTEGVVWSVDDHRVPGYDGLWSLEQGDHLRVIDDQAQTIWLGSINLEFERICDPDRQQQHIFGYWVHGFQQDLEPEAWAQMFFDRRRAILAPVPRRAPEMQRVHPFLGPTATLADRLTALTEDERQKLYHRALYPWVIFYSNQDEPSGLAINEWGFTPVETYQLIGSPSLDQLQAWKHYPKHAGDTLMPYTFDGLLRVALLFGVYGGLDWMFETSEKRITWLNGGDPSPKQLLLDGRLAEVRDLVIDRAYQ